jgi:hypothetical protein
MKKVLSKREPPVPLDERIKIQESYIDGLRKLRDSLSKSLIEAGLVLNQLLDERGRRYFEADMIAMDLEDAAARARMTAEGGKGGNSG